MSSFQTQIFYDNNPRGIFYAGQILSGAVQITLMKEKKVRSIYLTINGVARTSWNESESSTDLDGNSQNSTVKYKAEETYMNSVINILGIQQVLQPGKHTYNFMCALPPLLPCSYEGTYGFVRYTVKVTLDRPWKFDQTSKAAFTVIAPLDLNYDPKYKMSIGSSFSKSFLFSSGTLTIHASLPQNGYTPGQDVVVKCDVINKSKVKVVFMEMKIMKLAKFHSRSPKHKVKESVVDLVTAKAEGCPKRTNKTILKTLQMPVVPPSILDHCSIIDIEYVVKVKAHLSGCYSSIRLDIPITVGTVPITTRKPVNNTNHPTQNPGNMELIRPPQSGSDERLLNEQPPSYEQCTFGTQSIHDKNDSQHTLGFQNFTPSYPVYKY